jgi:hypothetical protein
LGGVEAMLPQQGSTCCGFDMIAMSNDIFSDRFHVEVFGTDGVVAVVNEGFPTRQ